MVWGCFCNNKIGPLVLIEGTLNSDRYIELLHQEIFSGIIFCNFYTVLNFRIFSRNITEIFGNFRK
jgi:hypothetical protein